MSDIAPVKSAEATVTNLAVTALAASRQNLMAQICLPSMAATAMLDAPEVAEEMAGTWAVFFKDKSTHNL